MDFCDLTTLSVPCLNVFKDELLIHSVSFAGGQDSFVMGRHADCDLLLAHPSISRHHVEIQLLHATREFILTDLASVHGTWINGEQVAPLMPVVAKENDSITLGASSRIFKIQWIPLASSKEEDNSQTDMPIVSPKKVDNIPAVACSTVHNLSAGIEKNEGERPGDMQRVKVEGDRGSLPIKGKGNSELRSSQVAHRRIPFADLQQTRVDRNVLKSPLLKRKTASKRSAKEDAGVQRAEGKENNMSGQQAGGDDKEQVQASACLWLRRCTSAPLSRLLADPPPSAPLLPVSRIAPVDDRQSIMNNTSIGRTMAQTFGAENALDIISSKNREGLIQMEEQRMQAWNEELENGCSQWMASRISEDVEEEYRSEKEHLPRQSEMQDAVVNWSNTYRSDSRENCSRASPLSRKPFQPLFLTSKGEYRSASPSLCYPSAKIDSCNHSDLRRPQRWSSSVAQNLDYMLRRLKLMEQVEPHPLWHIIVDTSCLMDSESFRRLKQLEGIRKTRLIIPMIVIRELDSMMRRNRNKLKSCPEGILKWIEACMVKMPSWMHVQNSSANLPIGARLSSSPYSTFSPLGSVDDLMSPTNGDHVLDYALLFNRIITDGDLVLLTNDTALRIKAMAEGIISESSTAFFERLLNPYSEQFLWAGSVVQFKHTSIPRVIVTTDHKKRTFTFAARDMACKRHHAVEGLMNHCKQTQGLKSVLD